MSVNPTSPPRARRRDFDVYWLGQSLSVLGDSFALVATPLLVLRATGSVAVMGLLSATIAAGNVVAGVVSGAIVDRVDRQRLMIACDLVRAILWASVPAMWCWRGPSLVWLFVVAAIGAVLGNAFQVACITAVPNLVPRERVTEANGRLQASFACMYFIGPTVSGFVCHRYGPVVAIAVDAASFVVSAVSMAFVKLHRSDDFARTSRNVTNRGDWSAGLRFLLREPRLRALTVLLAGSNLLLAARNDLVVYLVKRGLHGTDDDVGTLFSMGAAGAIVGALITAPLRRRWGFGASWLGGGFVVGVATALYGAAPSVSLIASVTAVAGFAETVRSVNSMSLRQEITPEALLGRVTAAFWTLIGLTSPLGAWLVTAFAARAGTRTALIATGVGMLLFTATGLGTSLRAVRASPAQPQESFVPPARERDAA